jgi:hypothetical protein
MKCRFIVRLACAILFTSTFAMPAAAQQILLDQPVRAGVLTLFPDLSDPAVYYYVSDRPRLAIGENGIPQFSFLRYVDNVLGGGSTLREGEGGGIVHAVVSLSVTREELNDAGRQLKRIKPNARIQGPVVYKSGKFGLVSSFRDPAGKLVTQVVGLGNAPVLDGEKAAVSIQLTKQGAKILWESFETATPDISFTFEMDMSGFRSPHKAVLEADFDRIYSHDAFAAGLRSTYVAAEIKGAFDDLYDQKAIKLTQVGSDEKQEALIMIAYNKVMEMMFAPVNGTGTPSLQSLTAPDGGSSSLLDRASAMFKENRERDDEQTKETRARADEIRKKNDEASQKRRQADTATDAAADLKRQASDAQARLDTLRKQADDRSARAATLTASAAQAQERADALKSQAATDPSKTQAANDAQADANLLKARAQAAQNQAAIFRKYADEAQPETEQLKKKAEDAQTQATKLDGEAPKELTPLPEESSSASFAVVATYEMKRVRQRGTIKIELNKYMVDTITLRFDQNVGDLRSLRSDPTIFRQVNLDDPLYVQRTVVANVDGVNSQDFGQFINTVSVQMTKRHAGGGITQPDPIVIDRTNFGAQGNDFRMVYGWKPGDDDRRRWLEYDYDVTWSFFGGRTMRENIRKSTDAAITLSPPLQRRVVEVQGNPTALAAAQVRTITVQVFYNAGAGVQSTKPITLTVASGKLSANIEFLLPKDQYDYQYEITWRLAGNVTRSSGRVAATESILLLDEVPSL